VAVYVTTVPVPFLNKASSRTPEQDAAESRRNKDWDPNAPLYGRNPARPVTPAPGVNADTVQPAPPIATIPAPAAAPDKSPPAVTGRVPGDPLGDFASARAAANSDPFIYFVQAGAFRTPEDAESQRVKLSLMGVDAKVSEREQSGRAVFRVRVGPFEKKEDADRQKERLESSGFETALVRVQR
jgi:cell division protein FtsN